MTQNTPYDIMWAHDSEKAQAKQFMYKPGYANQ